MTGTKTYEEWSKMVREDMMKHHPEIFNKGKGQGNWVKRPPTDAQRLFTNPIIREKEEEII